MCGLKIGLYLLVAGGLGPKEGEERKRVAPRMYDDAHKAVYVVVSASKLQRLKKTTSNGDKKMGWT